MRLSTALQIGNARMGMHWMRELGMAHAEPEMDQQHLHTPDDLAAIIAEWHDDEAHMFG